MQKRIVLWASIVIVAVSSTHCQKTKVQDSATFRRCFVGSSGFMIGNIFPAPPSFYQPNFGHRLNTQDVLSLEAITWRYRHPLGDSSFDAQKNKWSHYVLFEPGLRFGFRF